MSPFLVAILLATCAIVGWAQNTGTCPTNTCECDSRSSTCKKTNNGFTCICKHGKYTVEGEFICKCDLGYYYDKTTKKCAAQNDEVKHCLMDSCKNGEECENVINGIKCKCPLGQINMEHGQCGCAQGMYMNLATSGCSGQNAGAADCSTSKPCDEVAQRCENTADGTKCTCIYDERDGKCLCPKKYYRNKETDRCEVQDEGAKHCFVDDTCGDLEVCVNTEEGIQCNCKEGLKRVEVDTGVGKCDGYCPVNYYFNDVTKQCEQQVATVTHCLCGNTCDPKSENCLNNRRGYDCTCKDNHMRTLMKDRVACVPTCINCVRCMKTDYGLYTCRECANGYSLNDAKICEKE